MQSSIETESNTMRTAIDELQADTVTLKNEQTEMRALTNTFRSTLNGMRSGDLHKGQSETGDEDITIEALYYRVNDVEVR